MSHPNARTTYRGRLLIVERHEAGWPQAHIAKAMGVSRKCVATWIGRWRAGGADALRDRSSRPLSSPGRTSPEAELRVLEARRRERSGPAGVAQATGVPARTVSRILARHHMPLLRELDPITGERVKAPPGKAVRYERGAPGELVHMDVKKLGRIPDGGGWRARGRGGPRRRVGYDYVHTVIDDCSRAAYSEVLPDEKGTTCVGFLGRALDWFAARGVRVERLMTDNAWAYRYSLRQVCAERGVTQKFIRPHCPWQNGKAERFNRTLAGEWAYRRAYSSNAERTEAFAPWLDFYNNGRPHSALGGRPPASRLPPTS